METKKVEEGPVIGKRLALFFDGTWNEPGDHTNVRRMHLLVAQAGADNIPQKTFYDEGVGTHWYDRISGGAFGRGLSDNIRQGYCWLMENYDPGDEIYLFGFSRGAFTARSLAGIIARCGLLKPDSPMSYAQVFARYQKGDAVRPIHELIRAKSNEQNFDFEEKALLQHSFYHRNLIKMVGVWDTVGSIGVPFGNIPGVSRKSLWFHNTHLSTVVQHSYQALALDEYRSPYWAILWTHFIPDQVGVNSPALPDNRTVEQRWFSGAHANVGGGYQSDLFPQRPLAWMQGKAKGCGLGFRSEVSMNDEDLDEFPRDSYKEFGSGVWKALTLGNRYVRWVMPDPVQKQAVATRARAAIAGRVITVNERIDASVFRRCQLRKEYRPLSLLEWAKRRKMNLEEAIANVNLHAHVGRPVTEPGIEDAGLK